VPLVTTERWRNRRWATDLGPRGSRITAWGMPLALRLHDDHPVQAEGDLDGDDEALIGPGGVGRHYDLPGGHRLIWREVKPGDVAHPLRPFERTPGELDHLAEGGVRLSVLRLASVPENPIWRHRLTYPAGTRFVYQPRLTQAEIDEGCVQPRAVVGSYAVLDAEGCKIGHILRPCAISADRTKRVWGAISIEKGVSRVAFRPDDLKALGTGALLFGLDTFGYATLGGAGHLRGARFARAAGPHSPASDGTANEVHIGCNTDGIHAGKATLGFWQDSSNYPGARVGDTGEISVTNSSPAWVSATLDSPQPAVYAAQSYWIGLHQDSSLYLYLRYDSGTLNHRHAETTYVAGEVPDPYPSSSTLTTSRDYSVYIVYTASGGPTGVAPQFMHLARMRRA